jgi:hypothetical protein
MAAMKSACLSHDVSTLRRWLRFGPHIGLALSAGWKRTVVAFISADEMLISSAPVVAFFKRFPHPSPLRYAAERC